MTKLILFTLLTLPIVWLSRHSLGRPNSYGFFRFFAFEANLALILLNAEYWFRDPFGPLQIASWLLLCASLVLAMIGFGFLRRRGKPESGFDDTSVLVTSGVYQHIRHPLYSSLLFFAWGAFMKNPSLAALGLAIGASAFLVATALAEEGRNLEKFGEDYADYMKRTKRFIPFLF